ncbi:MAG: membrane protein insertase YidC, partial [Tannerellaceae bacterium]
MKTNLSSQITLTRIPLRYYRPENAYEHSVLTRFEKIPTNIYESADEGSFIIAKEIATQIRKKQELGESFVLGLPGGRSPQSVFKELVRMHKEEKLSFRNVIVFNVYEFYPLVSVANSNLSYLKEALLDQVDIDPANIYSPDGFMAKDAIYEFCKQYEQQIQSVGGIDYLLLGVGTASNIGFNGPGSTASSTTRLVLLDNDARKEASKTFKSIENVPASIITMGISTILRAKSIVLMAWGETKARIIQKTVEGSVSDVVPATYLQNHFNAKVVIDLSAAYELTRISHPWLVTNCEWDNQMTRRALVWLCQKTGKPMVQDHVTHADNGWIAISQHFFVSAFIPQDKQMHEIATEKISTNLYGIGVKQPLGTLAPGATISNNARLYSGPQISKLLEP